MLSLKKFEIIRRLNKIFFIFSIFFCFLFSPVPVFALEDFQLSEAHNFVANVASKVSSAGGNLADEAMHFAGKVSDKGKEASKEAIARMRSMMHNNKYYKKAQDPLGYGQYDSSMQRLDNLLAYAS